MEHKPIMEHKHSYTAVPNETQSFTTRTTRENKNLKYELKVLQQPQRARACGSGSKSSADRRPVDPPPIVQLKVLEMKPGANGEEIAEDITFVMNANYFLFATLEPARHLAQPRGMPDPNKPTVLTGTPVAGMVYLDRPDPAGYFIFPDLSVRHEGHFRLSFSLYEELKRTEDHDKLEDPSLLPAQGETHVTHRLEVKSEVLQVFSAKKFPGLTESTSLSRTVAEQGCRVRIRRDVRMRRTNNPRDAKGGKDWDDYEDLTAESRAKMARTADTPPYSYANHPHAAPPSAMEPSARPRSGSHGSHQSLAASLSRRSSQQQLAQAYQQTQQQQHQPPPQQQYAGTAPQTPQSGVMPSSAYGPSPSQQYSQHPYMQQPPQPLPQQQRQPMQPPPVQYQPQPYAPPPAAEQQAAHPGYPPAPSYQAQYAGGSAEVNGHSHRASGDWSTAPVPVDYRRTSVNHAQSASTHAAPTVQPTQPSYPPQPYQQASQPYQTQSPHQPHYYAPIEAQSTRAPPPEPIQPPHRTTAPTPPLSAKPFIGTYTLPPISHALEPASPAVHTPTSTNSYFPNSYIGQVSAAESHKRSYGSTFSTAHHDLAQKAGARVDSIPQSTTSMYTEFDVDDDDDDEGVLTAGYKRADGQVITRRY